MNAWYWAGYTLSKLIGHIFFHYRVIHRERMIQTGPVILAMNHQSYLDPPPRRHRLQAAHLFFGAKIVVKGAHPWSHSAETECHSRRSGRNGSWGP